MVVCYTDLMNKLGWTLVGILVLLIAAIAALITFWPKASAPAPVTETPAGDLTGTAIYASGTYGFTLMYPESASTTENFSTFYHLPAEWRANGAPNATGTPVIEIVGYSTESDHSFPRYYTAMVRVGVSKEKGEVAACEKIVKDQGEEALPDRIIHGVTWKAFSFQSAGMMQYVKGVSYRTIHEGTCYVMEKIATGSSYMDDPDSPDDVPQPTLDKAYTDLDPIVESFTFSTP